MTSRLIDIFWTSFFAFFVEFIFSQKCESENAALVETWGTSRFKRRYNFVETGSCRVVDDRKEAEATFYRDLKNTRSVQFLNRSIPPQRGTQKECKCHRLISNKAPQSDPPPSVSCYQGGGYQSECRR